MRRFLVFPLLLALWLVTAQVGLWALNFLRLQIQMRSVATDVYYHRISISLTQFFPAITLGLVLGASFASLDFVFHRRSRQTSETTIYLVQNLLRGGVVAVVLVLLDQVVLVALVTSFHHRRYYAYPPDMQFLNIISSAQTLFLLASVLWAMGVTLLQRQQK